MLRIMGEAPSKLGRFVCGERVASGPVGALHRARVFGDAGFEKDFALLVVDDELARDRAALGRLVRAANGWARLNYPRIAHAHELGAEGETYYLVSDWVRAATMGALLVDGPLPLDAALLLAADTADAVAHAHARHDLVPGGILHLGLSPESVLVDGEGNVVVRDFGLLTSRVRPFWADDDRLVYALRYCAPELLEGGVVDVRADVFALGALLFELVTGRPAFGGVHARNIAAQIDASPPSLTGVPPAAGPLLARALEARAAARLPSLTEFRTQALALVGDRVAVARKLLADRARTRLPAELARTSPLDSAVAEPAPSQTGIRKPTISDDFFRMDAATDSPASLPPIAVPPPPSMLPSPVKWGGRPLLPPAVATVWDPPSTTATTTLEALRRQRPRPWLRALVPLALVAAVAGSALVWRRVEQRRVHADGGAGAVAVAEGRIATARSSATPSQVTTRIGSTPPGAELYVDGELRGPTPQSLTLAPGEHRVVVVAEGRALWRGLVDAGATIAAQLAPARLPPTIEGEAGLKLVCKTPDVWRVFVDGVDTGRTCPVDERIPLVPGPHHLTLYAPRGDRTVEIERPAIVKDRGASTRIILDEE
jgi:eukaryotic-like serine/threonine-protein kinase